MMINIYNMQLKQKQRIQLCLRNYFCDPEGDLSHLQLRKFGANKSIYRPGDLINHLYLIVSGDVLICFHEKEQPIPEKSIIGDFEPAHQLSRRITQVKCKTSSRVLVLPFDYYFNINEEVIDDEKFLKSCVPLSERMAQYLLSKLFKKLQLYRGEQLTLEPQSNDKTYKNEKPLKSHQKTKIDTHIAILKEGTFRLKKKMGIAMIKKHKLQVQKNFDIVDMGSRQIINENVICQSSKGRAYFFHNYYLNHFFTNYQEAKEMMKIQERNQSHRRRASQIQHACRSRLVQLILPLPIKNQVEELRKNRSKQQFQARKSKLQKKKELIQKRRSIEKHQYKVQIKNTESKSYFKCSPTNSNLELVPLVNKKTPTKSTETVLPKRTKRMLLKKLNFKTQEEYDQQISERSENSMKNQQRMPEILDSKFKRKMLMKVVNPFNHFRTEKIKTEVSVSQKYYRLPKRRSMDSKICASSDLNPYKVNHMIKRSLY